MLKKIKDSLVEIIKEDWKFLLLMLVIVILLNYRLNYFIVTGGGISDISSRVDVEDKYSSDGSFNLSYVTQLDGTILSYLLSFVFPSWERESTSDYKYVETETIDDIDFRNDIDLKTANSNATYWAYTLANKEISLKSSKLYVISIDNITFKTNLKIKDQILSIDGNHFDTIKEYHDYLQTKKSSDKVLIKILRDKKEKEIECDLHEYDGKIILGVILQYVREYNTDPKIKIKFKSREAGPSAGLMTTLEIYNQLTKKDLTRGYVFAGTGTIEEDGSIGQIGGINYKILGASRAKADYFLSPSGNNYNEAKKYIKEKNLKIKLVEVKNINDAIDFLEALK